MSSQRAKTDATFIAFKTTGKFYSRGRGVFPEDPARVEKWLFDHDEICEINGGNCPGLNNPGKHFDVVVIPDDGCEYKWAWPRMIKAKD